MKPYPARAIANRVRVLFVSSEIYPLAKTGGLADVCGALPLALAHDGDVDILVMMPGYDSAIAAVDDLREIARLPNLPGGPGRLLIGTMPGSDLEVVLLDQPNSFQRPGGLYIDDDGREWADNAIRFAALAHAAVELSMGRVLPNWRADIVHCNDWHTGLIPVLLAGQSGRRPRTIMTLHNLAFQGLFPPCMLPQLDLPPGSFSVDGVEYFGQISFLKGGIHFADKLTTVSPTYATEIVTPEFGMGLEGVLARRRNDLVGIMNGIDETLWNPANDQTIAHPYSAADLDQKALCKAAIQQEWGLTVDPAAPLLVFAARLESQKMADTLLELMPELMERSSVQVAILGKGAAHLQDGFAAWPARAPGRAAVRIGYQEDWAHQLLAGGDILVHGARFEPCGLTPIYAMRYGTVPIVRAVGGLRDSVTAVGAVPIAGGKASGFQFDQADAVSMLDAIDTALEFYGRPDSWRQLQRNGMTRDFSWRGPAAQYRRLYEDLALDAA
ncbi:MAG TPA: glycogen synthase GlgA [Aliidongia sp.]|uniref:glycogen synthase GlgA n=1 Tax=Aliidongia sp. TaxID=1914230 RepID=UPI002DDD460B|nr:glycogen synthase GlgA [Aliidongia sp.]HEV2675605.1 glycogen synthase GlgA [Aliidongia sp.]